jgi:hypothetical protein
MRSVLIPLLSSLTLLAAMACRKEPMRAPKATDATIHKDPEPPMPPAMTADAMTADATSVKAPDPAPVPPPDPIESMTVPEDPVERARLYFEMGYGASALQVLDTLTPEQVEKPEIQLLYCRAAELTGRLKQAVAAGERAAKATDAGARAQAHLCQARAHWGQKEHAPALRRYEAAIEAAPGELAFRLAHLKALLDLKARDAFAKAFGDALARWPDQPSLLLLQGLSLEQAGARDKAHALYEKLTGSDTVPAWVEAEAFDRMGLLWIQADPKRARVVLRRCRERVPGAACPRTELALSPPDPRHPERRIRNVTRPGRYGDTPLPPP